MKREWSFVAAVVAPHPIRQIIVAYGGNTCYHAIVRLVTSRTKFAVANASAAARLSDGEINKWLAEPLVVEQMEMWGSTASAISGQYRHKLNRLICQLWKDRFNDLWTGDLVDYFTEMVDEGVPTKSVR